MREDVVLYRVGGRLTRSEARCQGWMLATKLYRLSANGLNRANNTSTLYEGEITQITPRPGFTLSAHNQKYVHTHTHHHNLKIPTLLRHLPWAATVTMNAGTDTQESVSDQRNCQQFC
ncbi:hypothetical protein T4E_5119 [Trichinella pseudospiralis]|uniref:Uncharacterized protein n=1 Tax=Trichinella pseudospiralis TaxID=6337 RepID=A0A0V0XF70_TRIPS|nr:hypothetical protein T4E_5119 [Trichinella pseudospiralis]